MEARLNALFTTAVLVILSLPLPAFSQEPSDRGFLAGKIYDLDGPTPRLPGGKPDLTGVWDRPAIRDITQSFTNPDGIRQVGVPDLPHSDAIEELVRAEENRLSHGTVEGNPSDRSQSWKG